jgi:YD repeat-containing protein
MKKQLFTLFLAAATTFVGCKDDNDSIPDVDKPSKLLSKVTETEDGVSTVYNLTYDNNKRLTSYKEQNNTEAANFTYDTNGNITKLEFVEGQSKTVFEITYNNGIPATGKFRSDDDDIDEDMILTYTVANNQVTEIKQKLGTLEYGKSTITYQNGNVAKVVTKVTLPEGEELAEIPDLSSTITYTYGSKKNMFPSAGFKYLLDPMGLSARFFAKNEIASEKFEGFINATTTYQYTYDSDGFPLTSTDSDGVTYKYEYK